MNSIEFEDIVNSVIEFVPVTEVLAATLNFAEPKNKLMIIAFKRAVESNTPPLLEIDHFGDTVDASAETKTWVLEYLFKCLNDPLVRHDGTQCDAGWMASEIMGHDFVSIALTGKPSIPKNSAPPAPAATPAATSGKQGKEVDNDTTGLVAWQAAILENIRCVSEVNGDRTPARAVLMWCRNHGPRDVFPIEQPDGRNSFAWIDREGSHHTTQLGTVQNVWTGWRKAGKIPVRK